MFIPFARAYDKEFSLAANYPKGHRELFAEWIKENYPGALLFHVESTYGTHQDIMFTAVLAISMNHCYNIKFLDHCLHMPDNKDTILQKNLVVVLSSLEMVAQARLLAIMYLSMILPLRWLAGNTHLLAGFGWCARSMGRAFDILRENVLLIKERPHLKIDEIFMIQGVLRVHFHKTKNVCCGTKIRCKSHAHADGKDGALQSKMYNKHKQHSTCG
jgi:hypothetical protein